MSWIHRNDLVLGARLAARHRLASLTVVATLGVGIALATGAFTFFDAVARGRLPFAEGARFVRIEAFDAHAGTRSEVEPERYHLLQSMAERGGSSFELLGRAEGSPVNLKTEGGRVLSLNGARVTPGLFAHLPMRPLLGRALSAADGLAGAEPVALLRESLWRRQYGRDPAILGRSIDVGGVPRTVVGIAPDDFRFPSSPEIWVAASEDPAASADPLGPATGVVGILRPGHTIAQAAAEVRTASRGYDATHDADAAKRLETVAFTDLSSRGIDGMLAATLLMTVLVLLVVASNVANLMYARTAARAAELAVRSALGASRARIVGQLFAEVALLAVAAAAIGLALSQWGLGLVQRSIEVEEMPFWLDFSPHGTTFAFVAAIALVASLIAGALPAWKATRRDLLAQLRSDTARGGFGFGRVGGTVMVIEMALSVALVTSAVSLARGVARYGELRVPVPDRAVLTAQLWIDRRADGDAAAAAGAERDRLLAATTRLAGVERAGAATSLPRMSPPLERVRLEPLPGARSTTELRAPVVGITDGFLEALDGRAIFGRLLRAADLAPGAAPVAVVNEPFAAEAFRGANPVGHRIRIESGEDAPVWREIVGVVPDLGVAVGDPDRAGGVYVPMTGDGLFYVVARTAGEPTQLADALRRALFDVDPALVVTRVVRLDAVAREDRVALDVFGAVLVGVGLVALALALVGMYAVVSFTITRRSREIGIRVALGALPWQILGSLFGRAAALLVTGGLVGAALGGVLVRLRGSIFASTLPDAGSWSFPAVVAALILVGMAACVAPARRALAIDPRRALQEE